MTFLLQFNSLRKRLNLQRKRRLHASPHTLSYEDTASNQRDKSLSFRTGGVARGAQTDFFVVSVSFQGLNQPLNLVKLDKTDIVTHVQTPSINSGLRTRKNSAWSLPQNQETRLLVLGLVVPLYVPISQPHSIYPLTALASAQDSQPPGDATGSVFADYGVPSIPTTPFVRLLRG